MDSRRIQPTFLILIFSRLCFDWLFGIKTLEFDWCAGVDFFKDLFYRPL
jgi:hypothetical protein